MEISTQQGKVIQPRTNMVLQLLENNAAIRGWKILRKGVWGDVPYGVNLRIEYCRIEYSGDMFVHVRSAYQEKYLIPVALITTGNFKVVEE